jgi:PAS domain S-box-containing protein
MPIARAAIVEILNDAVIVLDAEQRVAEINPAARQLIGRDAQVIGEPIARAFAPFPELLAHCRDALEANVEIVLRQNQTPRVYELRLSPLRDQQNKLIGRLVMLRDITARKQVEAELRESQTRFRQIIESANDIIYRTDPAGRFTFYNPIVTKLLGYSESELLGHHYLELIDSDQRKAAAQFYRRQLASKTPSTYFEFLARTKTGEPVWIGQNVQAIFQGDQVAGFQAVARDITARKVAEAALRESESKNRALLDALPDLIFTFNKDGIYLDYHASDPRLLLIPPEEFLGKPIQQVMPRPLRSIVQNCLDRAVQTGAPQMIEFPLQVGTATHHYEVRMIAYGDDKVVALTRDITERKVQEAEIVRRLRETTLLNRIVNAATSALEEQTILEIACAELARGLNVPQVRATLMSADGCCLNIAAEHIPADAVSAIGTVIPMTSNPATQFVLEHREPVAITHAQNDPRLAPVRDLMMRFNVSSILIVPLVIRGRAVGTFSLDAYEPHEFSAEEIALAQNVAAAVSQALDNARLYASVKQELTERKQVEAALRYRARFEELITSISTNFINLAPAEIDGGIHHALEAIGTFVNVDRSYVFLLSPDGAQMSNTHEWCPPGVEPQIANLQNLDTNIFPWWMEKLHCFEPIHIPRVADLPPEASAEKEILQSQDIQSIVVVPLIHSKTLIGFLGFDSVRAEKIWSDDDRALLKIVSEIIANALERKRVEAELRQQRDFALQVMGTMGQGLTVTNAEGCFDYVNPAYARMVGYAPVELIGKMPDLVTFPEDRAALNDARARRKRGEVTTYETRLRHRDGSTVYALITGVPRWSDGRAGAIAVITDLTERKRMEQDLARARDQAMEASRLKSEFLATMSHEIRTPMNSIIGMSEMLLGENLPAQPREFAEIIHQSASALLSIINDILDFSKIEAGKMILESVDFDFAPVIEGAVEVLVARAREKSLGLMSFIAPDIPRRLRGDPNRLRQILLNLIGNAVKFTARGEVSVHVELRAQTAHDVTVHFAISDTGIGISEAARARLFQPFTQADGSTTRKFGGTGLGLAICKRLVEMMDGEIGVASTERVGSTFWFTARLETTSAPAQSIASLRGLRVLVVDDIKSHRDIVCSYVSSWGMRSTSVADGADALRVLRDAVAARDPFDLAIVDWRMPDLDGWALARAIKHDPALAAMQLMLLTAFDERGKGEEALRAGFVAYLTKPVKQSHLFDAITRVFAKDASAPGVAPRSPNQTASAPQNDKLILLAEDNPINQKVALLQLSKLGYRAQTVATGAEAVLATLERADAYALVLMDCQMPEMDGFEATRAIRKAELTSGRHLPIIAMTANAMEGDRDRCIAAGMDDYISKPVNLENLGKILAAWISQEKGS